MKGIIFTEFLDLMEKQAGWQTVEKCIQQANLPGGGAYTSIGTYDHTEFFMLVGAFSQTLGIPPEELVKKFGIAAFGVFANAYGHFFKGVENAFDLLSSIENYIHPEVKKLYPDAQVPKFICERKSDTVLEMIYESPRAMHALADGLIEGCFKHYNETFTMQKELLNAEGSKVKYTLTK